MQLHTGLQGRRTARRSWRQKLGRPAILPAMLAILVSCGPKVDSANQLRLERAVLRGDVAGVREALESGAAPSLRAESPLPPLTLAVPQVVGSEDIPDNVRLEIVDLLIEAGAEVDPPCMSANSICKPLPHATETGRADLVRRLLSAGADPNSRNPYGLVPLMYALGNGQKATAQILLQHGADPDLPNQWGISSFFGACAQGETEFVSLMLEYGADLESRSDYGEYKDVTPLMAAAAGGHLKVVELLLEAGANPAAVAGSATTALSIAAKEGHADVVSLLQRAGSEPTRLELVETYEVPRSRYRSRRYSDIAFDPTAGTLITCSDGSQAEFPLRDGRIHFTPPASTASTGELEIRGFAHVDGFGLSALENRENLIFLGRKRTSLPVEVLDAAGLAWTGRHLLVADSGNNRIHRLRVAASGALESDGYLAHWPQERLTGVAWDGERIWISDKHRLYALEEAGALVHILSLPRIEVSGITFADGFLFATAFDAAKIYKLALVRE